MKKVPKIITINEPIYAAGLMTHTGMKSVFKDLPVIYRRYMDLQNKYQLPNKKKPWEYVSLSRDFKDDKSWDYLTGHVINNENEVSEIYTAFKIPAGEYAVFQIRPRFKFMLGLAIGNTKRYIYDKWMAGSQYEFAGHEFEYNNEKMFQECPNYIDLYVAVKDRK